MPTIALISDLHGRILLAFKLVERLQRERGLTVDVILQCGDMGIFPDLSRLDKATIRHAKDDPDELGFYHDFMKANSATSAVLAQLTCDMVCVRGNHEDQRYLDKLEQQASASRFYVDHYQRISICKSGWMQAFPEISNMPNILGIGRIGDEKGRTDDRFIQDYEKAALKKTIKSKSPIDLLLTHDSASYFITKGYGMAEIRDCLNKTKPAMHFFGHTGTPYQQIMDENGHTQSIKIAELEFNEQQRLPYGCMLLLHWNNQEDYQLEVIDEKWLYEYQASTWRYL